MSKENMNINSLSAADIFGEEGRNPAACPVVEPEATLALPGVSDAELVKACQERVCPFCPEKEEAESVRLRALAEIDNTRKRLVREKEEHIRYASENVLSDILPALDTLDLALTHAPRDEVSKNFVMGVDMTRTLFLESLARHGLTQVGQLGEPFDPAIHEAVETEAHSGYEDNTVCALVSKGYRLKDRLLRPARVVVCKHS